MAKFKCLGMTRTKIAGTKELRVQEVQRVPNTVWSRILPSHLLTKYINVMQHRIIILPVVLYGMTLCL
jgi:hypothetical protein